jgi:peptidyl-prolyl cis-trans isomerase D
LNRATDLFFEQQTEMQRLAFEVPDNLEEVAAATGRPVFETAFFGVDRYPAAVNYPQVENVAFSAELIDEGVNSELLQVSDDRVMVVRVIEHKPERTMALDEVKDGIEANLRGDKAQQAALQWAQALQTKMFTGEDIQSMLDDKSVAWQALTNISRASTDVAPELVGASFELSTTAANNSSVLALSNGNVGIVKLDGVNPVEDVSEQEIAAASQELTGQYAQRTYQNFVEALRSNADIKFVN